jgi:hypothetical protein
LDVPVNRQIIKFHESRHLQLRHGRTILRGGENYYRWCFPDLMTALAFVEQFGGALSNRPPVRAEEAQRRISAQV